MGFKCQVRLLNSTFKIFTQNSQLHKDLLKLALGAGHLTGVVSIIVTGHFGEPQISVASQSHAAGIGLCGRIACSLGTVALVL